MFLKCDLGALVLQEFSVGPKSLADNSAKEIVKSWEQGPQGSSITMRFVMQKMKCLIAFSFKNCRKRSSKANEEDYKTPFNSEP